MALDPLSAFSLACNVLQVIEVACKTLSTAADYRKSADGSLNEQKELRSNFTLLNGMSTGLQSLLSSTAQSGQASPQEIQLREANKECLRLSRDFLGFLEGLKVKDCGSTIESLRMSIKARWYRDRMSSMQQALSEARDNLNIAFLLYIQFKQALESTQTQNEIRGSSTHIEKSVLAAIDSSSASVQEELRKLAEQLKNTYLDSDDQTSAGFISTHQNVLESITVQLKTISMSQNDMKSTEEENRELTAQQKILDSLYFPEIDDRHDQVHSAYSSTYDWILRPTSLEWGTWDCFSTWINAPAPENRLYWIHGKPGCGKSTLMKFLDSHLGVDHDMSSWADGQPIFKARCFFWATGTTLQKSLRGLYRTILFQLLDQRPDMVKKVIPPRRWKAASLSGGSVTTWIDTELRNSLTSLIQQSQEGQKFLFLIDGLDEFEGKDEEQDDLVNYISHLSNFENVKVCVSSRQLNVFMETFGDSPQLQLQDLTRKDIHTYVESQLQKSRRWRYLEQRYCLLTTELVQDIIDKSSGVFLWVRLIVNDIMRNLRDGDGIDQLTQKLITTPADLSGYFQAIINSIESKHLREASFLLQLALHQETHFVTLHSLGILDVSFTEEVNEAFAIQAGYNLTCLDWRNSEAVSFRVESTIRKINSRCMGLLEVVKRSEEDVMYIEDGMVDDTSFQDEVLFESGRDAWTLPEELRFTKRIADTKLVNPLNFKVEFLHRSLYEFLLGPTMQNFLHSHTGGPIDARTFLCSARLVQFIAVAKTGKDIEYAIGVASYLMSAFSVNRDSYVTAQMASLMSDTVNKLVTRSSPENSYWYIYNSLSLWYLENSNFLTLAIDFNLTSFVLPHLTQEAIKNKGGRPILDYILRPRFIYVTWIEVNNRWPDPQLLALTLGRGADPNELHPDGMISVWAIFLSFIRDANLDPHIGKSRHNDCIKLTKIALYQALELMIDAGADLLLSRSSLGSQVKFGGYYDDLDLRNIAVDTSVLFHWRWVDLRPCEILGRNEAEDMYLVSTILRVLRGFFDFSIESLIQKVEVLERNYFQNMQESGKLL